MNRDRKLNCILCKVFKFQISKELAITQPFIIVNTVRTPPYISPIANLQDSSTFVFESCECFFDIPVDNVHSPVGDVVRLTFHIASDPKADVGSVQIPVNSLFIDTDDNVSAFAFNWNNVVHHGRVVGRALVGLFPLLPATILENTEKKIKKSWFGKHSKNSSEENKLVISSFVNLLFAPRLNYNSPAAVFGSDLLKVLEILKEETLRMHLADCLNLDRRPTLLAPDIFNIVLDLMRASLRQSSNRRDFRSCKIFLDLAHHFYFEESPDRKKGNHFFSKFVFTAIREHEVFKNPQFWETTFLDMLPQVKSEVVGFNQWLHLEAKTKEIFHQNEARAVLKVLHRTAAHMLVCGVPFDEVKVLVEKLSVNYAPSSSSKHFFDSLLSINNCIQPRERPDSKSKPEKRSPRGPPKAPPPRQSPRRDAGLFRTPGNRRDSAQVLLNRVDLAREQGVSPLITEVVEQKSIEEEDVDDLDGIETTTDHGQIGDWAKFSTVSGLVYYHNVKTNTTRWDPPSVWHQSILDALEKPVTHGDTLAAQTSRAYADEILKLAATPVFFSGEFQVSYLDRTLLLCIQDPLLGRLTLSNYRLIFQPFEPASPNEFDVKSFFECALHSIAKIEIGKRMPIPESAQYQEQTLNIWSKDHRVFRFRIHRINASIEKTPVETFVELINRWAFPPNQERCFAFSYKELISDRSKDGYNLYDVVSEFKRQGALGNSIHSTIKWSVSEINANFQFCPSYPEQLVIPTNLNAYDLDKVKQFRSKSRIPVLTFYYSTTGAALLRSSQPLCGLRRKRCAEDEKYLHRIVGIKQIYDCRPKVNAVANQAAGGGYETVDSSFDCSFSFMGIENIHVMRESMNRLQDLCLLASASQGTGREEWLSELDAVAWLNHIRAMLLGSTQVAKALAVSADHVLVHCSDGWDRTAQTCALAQLMLDPYFRTILGFEVLIEKEWISFGHKFAERYGHCMNDTDPQQSPIFIQFLDGVFQLLQQFPCSFEFSSNLLSVIADSLFSCRFGTFLYNNQRERSAVQLKTRTISLWTHVNSNLDQFHNPFYRSTSDTLLPSCDLRIVKLWPYYFRYDRFLLPKETMSAFANASNEKLTRQIRWLEERLAHRESELKKAGLALSEPKSPRKTDGAQHRR